MPLKIDNRHAIIGGKHRALSRYYMILNRIKGIGPKNKSYVGIKCIIPKNEFIDWFMKNDFKGCSVDRIDNDGDYELNNIRLIPVNINAQRLHTLNPEGCICRVCREFKPWDNFVKDKRIKRNGRTNLCSVCDKLRKIQRR